MGNKNFQKIISLLIVISLAFGVPFVRFAQVAQAQSVTSYITGVSGALTQLPLCTAKKINKVKGVLANHEEYSTYMNKYDGQNGNLNDAFGSLSNTVNNKTTQMESVYVFDSSSYEEEKKQTSAEKKTADSTSTMSDNDTCLKSIGRLIIKMLLQKLTISMVDWINGGYDGAPKFIQDPERYFTDIGKEEILKFGQEVSDPELYPFARGFIQAQANSFKSKFANTAQYSLDRMIYETSKGMYRAADFDQDFSKGGWAAWDAKIQHAANNPLGFSLMASNELASRIEKKKSLAEGSLQYGNGFLAVQKCTNPEGVTREEHERAINGDKNARECKNWQTVTPGSLIASVATKTMQNEETSLLKADDLNSAIAAIIDAFANSMTAKIQTDGYFGLSNSDEFRDGSGGQWVYNEDSMKNYSTPRTEQDFSEFQIAQSTFLSTHPDFNIRTDLTQALIDEQRIFIDKLIKENKELFYVGPNKKPITGDYVTTNSGLIPTIYQLDYCIPGPHPGWEYDSSQVLQAAIDSLDSKSMQEIEKQYDNVDQIMGTISTSLTMALTTGGAIIGTISGSLIPGIGNLALGAILAGAGYVIGTVATWVTDWIGSDSNARKKTRAFYASELFSLTGIRANYDNPDDPPDQLDRSNTLMSKQGMSNVVNTIFERYIKISNDVFDKKFLPTITEEANTKFLQAKGYQKMFKGNEDRIFSMQSMVKRLDSIKNEIDRLNCQIDETCEKYPGTNEKPTHITQEEYEEGISEWTSAFSRISSEMVSGDDIAQVDNTIKQIIDEKDYIYKDLLKGPNGCEKDLELMRQNLPWQIYDTKRMTYPLPILYDYNKLGRGEEIPDPYNSGYKNKIIDKINGWAVPLNRLGPGFLSYIGFQDRNYWFGEQCPNGKPKNENELHCRLQLSDLINMRDWYTALGDRGELNKVAGNNYPGFFEKIIGIY